MSLPHLTIFGRMCRPEHRGPVQRFVHSLMAEGFAVEAERAFARQAELQGVALCDAPSPRSEALVSIGGDGTLLAAIAWMKGAGLPVVGINTGHLGYLVPYPIGEADALVSALKEGTLRCEERSLLKVECEGMPEGFWPYALNEVAFLRADASSLIEPSVWVGSRFLARYSADGLLLATATGSTAYNLSVGGPLLQPTLKNIIISPVSPHSLTMRPLVIDGDTPLEVSVDTRAPRFQVWLDGRSMHLPSGARVKVSRAEATQRVLLPEDSAFADTLRGKLGWSL